MQIDLRTVTIEPRRKAFDHLIERFGDKPASRYQEGSYDIQAQENLHYRPTWDPDHELYDPTLSRIRMADWYVLKDPRQFYYSSYTLTRARQQDAAEMNFGFAESHGLLEQLDQPLRDAIQDVLVPLRHAAWGGANQNNTFVCGYGYGAIFTQPCMYHAMDNLAIAQYLTRLGLLLDGTDALARAKRAWTEAPSFQTLRRLIEDLMCVRDPFELFVAQNLVLDGLLYPVVYGQLVDEVWSRRGGASSVALLTQFQSQWFAETSKWIDSVIKTAAAESPENKQVLQEWVAHWTPRAAAAVADLVRPALGEDTDAALDRAREQLGVRLGKTGLAAKEH